MATVGGDLLSPYPLSALDQGRGMVDVLLQCGFRFACFGNHEADVGTMALRARVQEWRQGRGVWLNTNMPDLLPELELPAHAPVVGYSRDGQVSRRVCLLGVCTGEEGLYVPPANFGGAVSTAEGCNESALRVARRLRRSRSKIVNDTEGEDASEDYGKADAIVVLTHQDTQPDRDLAMQGVVAGIPLVLGGHDHEEYFEEHNGCIMAKAGMDAHKAVVADLVWRSPDCKEPEIDYVELVKVSGYSPSKAVSKVVENHMAKVWELEKLKGAMALEFFPNDPIIASKNIRERQTTMGTVLCNGLRDVLEADCVLFDGGNIRGDRSYIPVPGHHRGDQWAFTMADLELEVPWESPMVVVLMRGLDIAEAVRWSRSRLPELFGGFMQVDDGVRTQEENQAAVTHVAGEPLENNRLYRVGLMHCSLAGMNSNPVFAAWRTHCSKQMPHEDVGRPAKVLLLTHFARRTWKSLPSFKVMDTDGDGYLSPEEIRVAYVNKYPRLADGADAIVARLVSVADQVGDGKVTREEYERLFPLPRWMTLTYFEAEPRISSRGVRERQTSLGHVLCNALREELEVDCVLFDGGNIRGNMDYEPDPAHRRGHRWAFTLSDLRRELPWPTEMVAIQMRGADVAQAIQWSRSHLPELFGGFLQTDDGVQVCQSDQALVTHVKRRPIDKDLVYRVVLLRASLLGMNGNPVFEAWRSQPGNEVPMSAGTAESLLIRYFAKGMWKHMTLDFSEIDQDKDGVLSWDDLHSAVRRVFFKGTDRAGSNGNTIIRRLLLAAGKDGDNFLSKEDYDKLVHRLDTPGAPPAFTPSFVHS